MKRLFTLLIILALVLPLAFLSGCSSEGDLIKNGDFILRDNNGKKVMEEESSVNYKYNIDENDLPVDWDVFTSDSADLANEDVTSNTVYVSRESLAVLGETNKNYIVFRHTTHIYSSITQRIRVQKNTVYSFSFQYKINSEISLTSGGADVSGFSAVIMEEERHLYTSITQRTDDWQTYTATFNSGNYSVLHIGIRLGLGYMQYASPNFSKARGTAFAADISLKRGGITSHTVGDDVNLNLINNEDFIKKDSDLVRQKTHETLTMPYELNPIYTEVYALDPTGWKLKSTGDTAIAATHYKSSQYNKIYINCLFLQLHEGTATVTTRVKVEKNTVYRFSYAYWILDSVEGGDGNLTFKPDSPTGFGVRPIIMSDKLYKPYSRTSSYYDWTTESIYFNSGSQNYLDIGVAVGDASALTSGYVRLTNFILDRSYVSDYKDAYIIASYSGDGVSKTGGWVLVSFLTLAGALICAFSYIMLSQKAANKKVKAVAETAAVNNEPQARPAVQAQTVAGTGLMQFADIKTAARKVLTSTAFIVTMVLAAAFLIRLFLAYATIGFRQDLTTVIGYADNLKRYTLSSFYQNNIYANPPLYIYFMKLLTMIFGGVNTATLEFSVVMKLPSILADVSTALVIFLLAKKYCNRSWAIILAALYALNPLSIMDSAMWGQTESVVALFVITAFYFLIEKKYLAVFIFYTLAMLTGLSALIAAPVFIAYFGFVWIKALIGINRSNGNNELLSKKLADKKYRDIWLLPLYAIGSYVMIYLLCLPFSADGGIFTPIVQFFYETIRMSAYFGNNIFNIFGLFGKNLEKLTPGASLTAFMILFGVILLALSVLIYFFRRNRANMVLACALIYILTIQFMVDMTPRYYVIAGALLLISFALIKDRRILHSYMMVSVVGVFNMGAILANVNGLNRIPTSYLKNIVYSLTSSDGINVVMILGSLFALLMTVYVIYTAVDIFIRDKRRPIETSPDNRLSEALKSYIKSF